MCPDCICLLGERISLLFREEKKIRTLCVIVWKKFKIITFEVRGPAVRKTDKMCESRNATKLRWVQICFSHDKFAFGSTRDRFEKPLY